MATADPGLGSWTPPNMFAMLRAMVNAGVIIFTGSGAPTNGTSGTGAGTTGKGSIYVDISTGNQYINAGTTASPIWNLDAASGGALSGNASISQVTNGYAADTLLAGSAVAAPLGGFLAKNRYYCYFDMVKTAAGTAQFTVTLRIGTTGTVSDAAICTFAFAAGTAAADTGSFEVFANFQSVGGGTSAVVAGVCVCSHALAATGLISTGASGNGQIQNTSAGFNSTTGTFISLSVNGGASFSGTNSVVQAELHSF